jgi:tryptophan synthase alpha chain
LSLISLAAPTTSAERLPGLAGAAQGYLYYVSFAGVTGAKLDDTGEVAAKVAELKAHARVPVLVGFGIKDAASAAAVGASADGVVVGSALVERIAGADSPGDAAARAGAFLAPLRAALDAGTAQGPFG